MCSVHCQGFDAWQTQKTEQKPLRNKGSRKPETTDKSFFLEKP